MAPSQLEIAERLRGLSERIGEIAADMRQYGVAFSDWEQHARELIGVGAAFSQWADRIEAGQSTKH